MVFSCDLYLFVLSIFLFILPQREVGAVSKQHVVWGFTVGTLNLGILFLTTTHNVYDLS